jgi:hypothetical protein
VRGGAGTVDTSIAEATRGPISHFAAPVCSHTTHSGRWTFGPRPSSTPEPHATEDVFRDSPSVWRGGYRRYIQRGSRQRAPKALCSARFKCSHTTHSGRWTFGSLPSSTPEPHATEGVFRASPSVWRGGYRRYIHHGSRQRAPKSLCSARLFTHHTQWSVDFCVPPLLHPGMPHALVVLRY